MTYVSTPTGKALPRRRVFQPGTAGAIALVLAVGAAIAGGIAVTGEETQPVTATVSPSADTFTLQREGGRGPEVAGADRAHLNRGADLALQGLPAPMVSGEPG